MGGGTVTGYRDAEYRLEVAQGFLSKARQDVQLERWRSTVDNAQLAVENAAKAVLALVGPVGRTHNPAIPLRQALQDGVLALLDQQSLQRLIELAELMGPDVHIQTDYGDEMEGLTPWELFDQADAQQSLTMAEEAVTLFRKQMWYNAIKRNTDEGETTWSEQPIKPSACCKSRRCCWLTLKD
jgi:HEPN domain-containing protein